MINIFKKQQTNPDLEKEIKRLNKEIDRLKSVFVSMENHGIVLDDTNHYDDVTINSLSNMMAFLGAKVEYYENIINSEIGKSNV